MGKVQDLTGRKFGKLTVIGRDEDYISPKGERRRRWKCLCECGNELSATSNNLKKMKSCGCARYPDLTGRKFGMLKVIEKSGIYISPCGSRSSLWRCRCECGRETTVMGYYLTNGHTKSCGCLKVDSSTTHGMSKTRVYKIWSDMITRCYRKCHGSYKDYGGRGITVCDEWRNSPEKFIEWAFINGYSDELSIDRIDSNGNYEPSNCRWATRKEQANNTRRNHRIVYNGKTQTLKQWAEELGISYKMMTGKIHSGYSLDEIIKEQHEKLP